VTTPNPTAGQAERPRRFPLDWLSLVYLSFVVIFSAWICTISLLDRVTVPIIDDWRILGDFYSMSLGEWLFSDQNGHRTVFTFALFALDYAFFGGRQELLVVATLLTAWVSVGVLVLGCRTGGGLESAVARTAVGFACFATFWSGSAYNFLWGVNQGNPMVAVWLFLSLTCVVRYVHADPPRAGRSHLLLFAAAAAFCAGFTLLEGIATWLALVGVAIAARLPLRLVGLFAAGFALTALLYGWGLAASGGISLLTSAATILARPVETFVFVASFLGSALGRTALGVGLVDSEGLGGASAVLGGLGLAASASHALWVLRRRATASPQELLGLGTMVFAVAVALEVALGRMSWAVSSFAYAVRFVHWSALFWIGGALVVPGLVRGRSAAAAAAAIVAISVCMVSTVEENREELLRTNSVATNASLGVLLGVRNESLPRAMGGLWAPKISGPRDARARKARFEDVVERLKRDRRSFFADSRADLPGASLPDRFGVVSATRCQGSMARPVRLEGAVPRAARVRGWTGRAPRGQLVVISDAAGIIRGLGSEVRGVGPVRDAAGRSRWVGYVTPFDPSERYTAYVVLSDGHSACPLKKR
jgi:hypothetical protein